MITVNANASTLCPKTKPEDMEKLKEHYRFLDSQLAGLESKMKELGCEKLVIPRLKATERSRNNETWKR